MQPGAYDSHRTQVHRGGGTRAPFGRAAEACFVSQPTLSVAIRKLEDELGVTLFERGGAEVGVTPIGQRIVAQAQKVLEESASIKGLRARATIRWPGRCAWA